VALSEREKATARDHQVFGGETVGSSCDVNRGYPYAHVKGVRESEPP
jgi:hypothetical protein